MLSHHFVTASLLDIDAEHQPELAAVGELGVRWRCLQSHVALAVSDALATNYTGLGWSSALVQPLIGNLTGCLELTLDDLRGDSWLVPLGTALAVACPAVGDPSRPWEPARSAAPLRTLDFEGSRIAAAGAEALAPIVRTCTSIESLHVPNNRLGDVGVRALAGALFEPPHPAVRVLDLHANQLSDDGAHGVATLLTLPPPPLAPPPLAELRLTANHIGAVGFRYIAEALRDNTVLETLSLSGNPGGDDGVAALAHALVHRKPHRPSVLRRLYVGATNLSDVGARALLDALREPICPPLEALVLDANPAVSDALKAELAAAIASRRANAQNGPSADARSTGIFLSKTVPAYGASLG